MPLSLLLLNPYFYTGWIAVSLGKKKSTKHISSMQAISPRLPEAPDFCLSLQKADNNPAPM